MIESGTANVALAFATWAWARFAYEAEQKLCGRLLVFVGVGEMTIGIVREIMWWLS